MKRQNIIIIFLSIILAALLQSACETTKNPADTTPAPEGVVLLKLSIQTIPAEVNKIIATMTRSGFEPRIKEFSVSGDSAFVRFENLASGMWHLKVDALNSDGIVIFTGETDVNIIPDQTVKVYLTLSPVGGAVEVYITWGQPRTEVYVYDFADGDLSGWSGPASAEIVDEKLHLWHVYGFKWHTIAPGSNKYFTSGTIEFDVKPGDGDYCFETKGGTLSTNEQNWGVYLRWRNGTIQVHQWDGSARILVDTHVAYEANMWYHIRIKFDNDSGQKGKFMLWSRPLVSTIEEKFVGEFDHVAEHGKLIGVNVISLGVYDPAQQNVKHIYFDNFNFNVTP